ncbi:MAG: hypothetical protein R8G66_06515 [Cytophagales bacterium]|nr:hypothetical protein [Cytophagales bacterium]
MPISFNAIDCTPLVIDNEFEITDEGKLASYVAEIVLGRYANVKRVLKSLATTSFRITEDEVSYAIARLDAKDKSDKDIEKRDGWIFQIISWLALFIESSDQDFYNQPPHDAPAQHGLDGIAVTIGSDKKIEEIVITEDKFTKNPRNLIQRQIWPEFSDFEMGIHDNKIVGRISALLEHLDGGTILEINQNDLCSKELRRYRVGINRLSYHADKKGKETLFNEYDKKVVGSNPHRRFASTIYKDDIRKWMDDFILLVIEELKKKKPIHV